ncbi:FRIGIDA-like protein 4a [Ranunculus cassubicifolius]
MKERAKRIADVWKESLDKRGGIENVKTPDVHTFLQHLVTFGIVSQADMNLYRKLIVGSAWRKQMPRLAVSVGLGNEMSGMIEELISKGQQVDAVHFTYEMGLANKFPPVPLLKAYLRDSRRIATSILEDRNNPGRALLLAGRKEQSALKAVIKCIEEYKLEADFPSEGLRKRLEQLEKAKVDKKKPTPKPTPAPANKRTRAGNNGPMPPAKAGRLTNAYVSSFPTTSPTYVHSPQSQSQYSPQSQSQYSPQSQSQSQYSPQSQSQYSPQSQSQYSPQSHTQYSPQSQPQYSPQSHSHSQQYSPQSHSHSQQYSPQSHTQYSPQSHTQYSPQSHSPSMYGNRSPPTIVYSPEVYPGAPMNYPAVYGGGYGNGLVAGYPQAAYYR